MTGFEKLEALARKFEGLPDKVEEFMGDIVRDNDAFIEDLNNAQLDKGLDADGNQITPEYTPFTKAVKISQGKNPNIVTLEDTGAYRRKMKAKTFPKGFAITNDDSKSEELRFKYGNVEGLTDESKQIVLDELFLPELPNLIKNYIRE